MSALLIGRFGLARRHYANAISPEVLPNLVEGILAKDRRAISRSITLLESKLPTDRSLANDLFSRLHKAKGALPAGDLALRLGFTGAPGVGKSTLIESFGMYLVGEQSKSLAVLTVDPSSVKSGGSILGDKTRMPTLSLHPSAYIRSSPSQGDSGGVISSTFDAIRLCELARGGSIDAGFDVILVETVGVGQSELALVDLVDVFVLLVAPGIGDELQGLKKGITEIADLILVNKADDPMDRAANQTIFEYRSAMKLALSSKAVKVLPVSGRNGRGIPEAWRVMGDIFNTKQPQIVRLRQGQACHWASTIARQELIRQFETHIANSTKIANVTTETVQSSARKLVKAWQASFSK